MVFTFWCWATDDCTYLSYFTKKSIQNKKQTASKTSQSHHAAIHLFNKAFTSIFQGKLSHKCHTLIDSLFSMTLADIPFIDDSDLKKKDSSSCSGTYEKRTVSKARPGQNKDKPTLKTSGQTASTASKPAIKSGNSSRSSLVTKRGPSESSIVPNTRNSNSITKPSAVSRTSSTTPSRPRTQNSVGRASAAAASTTSSRTRPVSSAGRASSSTVSTSVTASRPKTTPGATKYSHNYNRKPTTPTSSCSTKSSQKQISGHNSTKSQPKTISKPTSTTISSKETKSSHKKLPESNLKTFQPTSKEISSKQLQQSNTEPLKTRTLGCKPNL